MKNVKEDEKNRSTSMKDIARLAGVSVATVSRSLHRPEMVTEETKEKVLQAATELNYMPNRLAQSLRTRRSEIIGLVVPDVINPIYTELVEIIQSQFDELGYSLFLCQTGEDPKKELKYLRLLQGWKADGIIIAPVARTEISSEIWKNVSGKLIQLSRYVPGISSGAILSDNYGGAWKATNHLIKLGYKRIAMIGGPMTVNTARDRAGGYFKALGDAEIRPTLEYVTQGAFSEEEGYNAVKRLLTLDPHPEAIFCCSNLLSLGALTALKDAKVKIPEDMAFVSFDDLNTGSILNSPLTCVAQRIRDIGMKAVELIMEMIELRSAPNKMETVPTELIIRESCGHLLREKKGLKCDS